MLGSALSFEAVLRSCAPGKHNEPRRKLRQGNIKKEHTPDTFVSDKGVSSLMSLTTLGNGYLGSRIDEERSEMRYLV